MASSKSVVIAALFANGAIAILKFGGFLLTGSPAMLSETYHSISDTGNQVFLLIGIRYGAQDATRLTLYGNVDLREVDLAFDNAEHVAEILVQEGDLVTAGQVLAALHPHQHRQGQPQRQDVLAHQPLHRGRPPRGRGRAPGDRSACPSGRCQRW